MTGLGKLGEFGLIERLRQRLGPAPAEVALGIGDDCAALQLPAGEQLLVTCDLLLEGVHFRRDWTDLRRLGRKSVAVNLSDIAAMGGTPRQLVLGLGLPGDLSLEEFDLFLDGFCAAAAEHQVAVIGGDTCRAQQFLTVSVTAFGSIAPNRLLRRSGARPGDLLLVSGTLGDSALALAQLQRGEQPEDSLLARHLDPTPQVALGRALAECGGVSAMIDLSDGLLADLGHLLEQSGVGARLETAAIPRSKPFARLTAGSEEGLDLALAGGEDYELLLTAAPEARDRLQAIATQIGVPLAVIGEILPEAGELQLLAADGRRLAPGHRGYNHFARD